MNTKDLATVLLVIFIWGVNFWFMKIALDDIPPLILGLLRFIGVLFPAVFLLKRPAVRWQLLALYGLCMSFGQFSLVFLALHLGFATGLAALVLQVQVFLTVLFAFVLLKEPVRLNHFIGMISAGVGLIFIAVGHHQGNLSLWSGLPIFGAALSWASGNIVIKKIGQVDALSLVVWGNVSALVAFALASLGLYGVGGVVSHIANLSIKGLIGVLFLAYVSSLIGYTGWGSLLSRHSAGRITPFALGVPVIALLTGFVVLGERLGVWHWAGVITVMIGLIVHVFGGRFFAKR